MCLVRFLSFIAIVLNSHSVFAGSGFEGAPELRLIENTFLDRYRTTSEFIYRQGGGRVWVVPSGSLVDGRGFPRLFIDFFGPTLDSYFVNSAVVYDYSVKTKHHPWVAAQNMAYEAMQAEGMPRSEANLALMLLRATGTRWAIKGPGNCFSRCHGPDANLEWRPIVNDVDVLGLVDWARDKRLRVDQIESRVKEIILEEGPHSTIGIR
ncbi:DUF1353 domain-containing protein [Burkholderiales bacterium]|nr:DUF1353 domain-containing protein [Burkholderiales bacterium]